MLGLTVCVCVPPVSCRWVETGCVISPHYDSLLGKAMTWAPTRDEAAAKMANLLDQIKLQGPPNNLEFLKVRFLYTHAHTRTRTVSVFACPAMFILTLHGRVCKLWCA